MKELSELYEFWSELSDMLSEKRSEILEAKRLLAEQASAYHRSGMDIRVRNLNLDLTDMGGKPIESKEHVIYSKTSDINKYNMRATS